MQLFYFFVLFFLNVQVVFSKTTKKTTGIYSKHWICSIPSSLPEDSLLIHNLFVVSFNSKKNFASWVAYQLSPSLVLGHLRHQRVYVPDPLLNKEMGLKLENYKGASNCDKKGIGYDKGHLAPLASFGGSTHMYELQYLSNISPQSENLNRGPWKKLEGRIRNFVKEGNNLSILTGPIYGTEGKDKTAPCWKAAQGKISEVPVAFWKIISFKQKSRIKICSFLMPQTVHKKSSVKKYKVHFSKIEQKTGLKFFSKCNYKLLVDCKFLY